MPSSEHAKKILIVDDETAVVSYLEMLLHDRGYETLSASDGLEGMDLVRRERPDLVTLDVLMPKASGTRFYEEMKSDPELAPIPVVVVTALTDPGENARTYLGFLTDKKIVPAPEGFFSKPIDKDEFLTTVQNLLA